MARGRRLGKHEAPQGVSWRERWPDPVHPCAEKAAMDTPPRSARRACITAKGPFFAIRARYRVRRFRTRALKLNDQTCDAAFARAARERLDERGWSSAGFGFGAR